MIDMMFICMRFACKLNQSPHRFVSIKTTKNPNVTANGNRFANYSNEDDWQHRFRWRISRFATPFLYTHVLSGVVDVVRHEIQSCQFVIDGESLIVTDTQINNGME